MATSVRWRREPVNLVEAAALLAAAASLGVRLGTMLLGGAGGTGDVPGAAAAGSGLPPADRLLPWLGLVVYALARRWVPVTPGGRSHGQAGGTWPGANQGQGPARGREEPHHRGAPNPYPRPRTGPAFLYTRGGAVAVIVVVILGLVVVAGGLLGWAVPPFLGRGAVVPRGPEGAAAILTRGLKALGLLAVPAALPWPVAGAVTLILFQAYRRDGRLRPWAAVLLAATVLCFGVAWAGIRPSMAAAGAATAYGLALGLFNARYTGRSDLGDPAPPAPAAPARDPGRHGRTTIGVARPVPVVISGFYGAGNTGDEAILAALLNLLRQHGYRDITVFSTRPEATARRHGVASVYRGWRRHWLAKARALLRAGIFISGGGGLLQDTTPTFFLRGPVPYYLLIATWARLAGCWVLFLGQGVGPLRGRWTRWLTRHLADHADVITVRDAESLAVLDGVGVTRPPRRLLADFVFAAPPPDPGRAERVAKAEGLVPGARRVVVSVRSWAGEDRFYPELAAFLAEVLAHRPDVEVVMVPMEGELDRAASEKLASLVAACLPGLQAAPAGDPPFGPHPGTDPLRRLRVMGAAYEPADIEALVASAHVAVGMRLHFLLFAARAGVPVLALNYDPKVGAAMRRLGMDRYVFELDRVRAADLRVALAEVERDYDRIARELRQASAGLAPLAAASVGYVDAAARRVTGAT